METIGCKKIDIVKHVTNYTEIKRWNQLKEDSIVLKMENILI